MRSRRRSRKKPSIPWKQIAILTLVGSVAVLCGWLINTLLLQGYLWAPAVQQPGSVINPQPDPDPTPSITEPQGEEEPPLTGTAPVDLRSMQFYLTQVGAVGSESGATAMIKELHEQGNAAAYHFDGQLYRVYTGIFADKGAADALVQMFKSMEIDAFAKEVSWPANKGELVGEVGHYFAQVQPVVTQVEEGFRILLAAESVGRDQVIKLQQDLQTAQGTITEVQPASEVASIHNELRAACSKLKHAVDTARQFIETGNDYNRIISESSLIEFAELYQKFVSSIQILLASAR